MCYNVAMKKSKKKSKKKSNPNFPQMAQMPYHSGIEVRAYMTYEQQYLCARNFGAAEFIYNRMVALNKERYELKKVKIYCELVARRLDYINSVLSDLEHFQNSIPFLNEADIDAQTIANARQNYNKAWHNFRENPRTNPPTFHKRSYARSYQTNAHYKPGATCMTDCNVRFIDLHHLKVPKLGVVKVSGSQKRVYELMNRKAVTRIGTVTVRVDSVGRYYISLQLASMEPFVKVMPKTGSMRGYDVNLKNFMTDSDGNVTDNLKIKRSQQKRLSKSQHKLSRMEEHAKKDNRSLYTSKNYQKQRRKVANIQSHIANRRDDMLHVLSKHEVESQDFMFSEDLKITNMVKNHKLAYAITDVAWGTFFHYLDYKSAMYGKSYLKVPPYNSSQTCSECGYVLKKGEKLSLDDREWVCPYCGVHHDRDHNSAKVILFRGMAAAGM